ncbi:uncharacterized protein EV420DRAFT_1486386 [Desarmillaria tabescens]|uniref:Uncharacterized protein n=1 Tax=Armillaria tabescens TaxID=1929756 RepID=A0AA39JBI6_ARMTA|nr:uncharacterized protein EV420DRAFT_1486386 [Desarmillaria tabescens]KAK0439289.1 hypothetical protein EV420DRAFT_1486386 [Desarmillaria tabescens]
MSVDVDPDGILERLAGNNFLVHTEDNEVSYFRGVIEGGKKKYVKAKPHMFKIGDVVEAQYSVIFTKCQGGSNAAKNKDTASDKDPQHMPKMKWQTRFEYKEEEGETESKCGRDGKDSERGTVNSAFAFTCTRRKEKQFKASQLNIASCVDSRGARKFSGLPKVQKKPGFTTISTRNDIEINCQQVTHLNASKERKRIQVKRIQTQLNARTQGSNAEFSSPEIKLTREDVVILRGWGRAISASRKQESMSISEAVGDLPNLRYRLRFVQMFASLGLMPETGCSE